MSVARAQPTESIGPYELGELLARGPVCRLDRARDRRFDRPVILKRSLDPAEAEALERRLERQGRFAGPRVVAVHDVARDGDGNVVGVLEAVAGPDLACWLRSEGRALDVALVVDLLRQVLAALEEIHRAGGAHGLIEPEHLLLGRLDGRPLIRLTSFASGGEADPAGDLQAVTRLFDLLGPVDALPSELAEVVGRAGQGDFGDASSFREALRPGELGHWTRKVLLAVPDLTGAPLGGAGSGPTRPETRLDETLVALVDGARRLLEEEAYDLAGDLLREVLSRRPDHAEAVRLLHRAESSLEGRTRGVEERPTLVGLLQELDARLAAGELTVAESLLERLVAEGAEAPEVDAARQRLAKRRESAATDPPNPVRDALRAELEAELARRDPGAAARVLERLFREGGGGEDLGLWRLRLCGLWVEEAEELLRVGSLEEARARLGEAQRLAPGSSEVQRVSEVLEEARDHHRTEERIRARAEALAEICHLLDGDRLRDAWEVHQTVRARLGNWNELEAVAAELAELLVAEAQWSAARDRIDDAADLLRRATVVDAANPHARSLLAATEAALSDQRQRRRVASLLQQAVSSIEEMLVRGDLVGARAALEFARGRFGTSEALAPMELRLEELER